MAVQLLQAFVPAIDAEELAGALERSLARRCYTELERLRLPASVAGAEVMGRIAAHPGSSAIAWFLPPVVRGVHPAALHWLHIDRRRWDPALVRALSAEVGGFAAAVESTRTRDEAGAALFYAGRTVELACSDPDHREVRVGMPGSSPLFAPGMADEEALERFYGWFSEAAEGWPEDFRWPSKGEVHIWHVMPPPDDPYALEPADDPPLARALFPFVGAEEFRAALASLVRRPEATEGWRWLARESAIAGVPYVLLEREGRLDEERVLALAHPCNATATAVELPPQGRPFRWLEVEEGERVTRGEGQGAAPLLYLLGGVAVLFAEASGALRWPAGAGEPL